jgi:hypothetical protein
MIALRVILMLLIPLTVSGVGYFGYKTYLYEQQLQILKDAVLADIPVDATKHGSVEGTVQITTLRPCKVEFLLIRTDGQPLTKEQLGNFRASITLHIGVSWGFRPIDASSIYPHRTMSNAVVLYSLSPWNEEPTTFTFTCMTPIEALQNVPHRLQVKYELCGIEQMPAILCFALTCLCAGLTLFLVYGLYRLFKTSSPVLLTKK